MNIIVTIKLEEPIVDDKSLNKIMFHNVLKPIEFNLGEAIDQDVKVSWKLENK